MSFTSMFDLKRYSVISQIAIIVAIIVTIIVIGLMIADQFLWKPTPISVSQVPAVCEPVEYFVCKDYVLIYGKDEVFDAWKTAANAWCGKIPEEPKISECFGKPSYGTVWFGFPGMLFDINESAHEFGVPSFDSTSECSDWGYAAMWGSEKSDDWALAFAHEMGHSLGYPHVNQIGMIMNPKIHNGGWKNPACN